MAGYSGTPLPKKLGIKEGHRLALLSAPDDFEETLGELDAVTVARSLAGKAAFDVIIMFTKSRAELAKKFQWTNDDQNSVARSIAVDKLSDEEAAKKWVDANQDKVKAWLPAGVS